MSPKEMFRDYIRFMFKCGKVLALVGAFLLFIVCVIGLGPRCMKVYEKAVAAVDGISEQTFVSGQSSLILDVNGEEISRVAFPEKDIRYMNTTETPYLLPQIVIEVEDRRFLEHHGVDWLSFGKACIELVKNDEIVRGGSTISQQLARNMFLGFEQTFDRKLCEMIISVKLEKIYTKEQILNFYLNNINYGGDVYGFRTASLKYFSKEPLDLSLSEIVYLVGIPNSPARLNPMKGTEEGMKRRDLLLDLLASRGVISEEEAAEAKEEEIVLDVKREKVNDYLTSYAVRCAVESLMRQDEEFEFQYVFKTRKEFEEYQARYNAAREKAENRLCSEGLTVKTSLDSELQKTVQGIVTELVDGELECAATVVDNRTGVVVSLVGGNNPSEDYTTFNRAFQGFRQPGSCFKPILVYADYLNRDGVTPYTMIQDKKLQTGLKNYDNKYLGEVSINSAIVWSKNAPAAWCLKQLGVDNQMEKMKTLRFSRLVDDYNLSAALGGLTYGVTTTEMAGAYATLANDGVFLPPDCVTEIYDSSGELIYDRSTLEAVRVYDESAVKELKTCLRQVLTQGTGKLYNQTGCYGKTGTTNDDKDSWLCGFNDKFTVTVWVGYDSPKTIKNTTLAGKVWKEIMWTLRMKAPTTSTPEPAPATAPAQKPTTIPTEPTPTEVVQVPTENAESGFKQEMDKILGTNDYNIIEADALLKRMKGSNQDGKLDEEISRLETHIKEGR